MQIFKLFFKILNKNKKFVIMYFAIFMGILSAFLVPTAEKTQNTDFTNKKCKYAIFDYDHTGYSENLQDYLAAEHKVISIKDDSLETIQDELYNMTVDAVIIIKDGFGNGMMSGDTREYLDIYVSKGTYTAMLSENIVNNYISYLELYVKNGESLESAAERTKNILAIEVKASYPDGEEAKSISGMHFFFQYLGWIFIVICVQSIAPVLNVFDRKEVRDRVSFSSYKFSRINIELIAGMLLSGLIVWGITCGLFTALFGVNAFDKKGILLLINALCYMTVALAITFLISKITDKAPVMSMLSNVVSLGMAFTCGVFVPIELLSAGVLKVAQFLPTYWYVVNIGEIDKEGTIALDKVFGTMGIQLLFAAAIVVITVVIAKKKQVNK